MNAIDVSGEYTLSYNNKNLNLSIDGAKGTLKNGATALKSKFSYKDNWVTITMNNQNDTSKYTRFVGALDDNQTSFSGTVVDESGKIGRASCRERV